MEKFQLPDMNKEYSITKTFRLKYQLLEQLEDISKNNDISVNKLVTVCIEFALKNLDESNIKKDKE